MLIEDSFNVLAGHAGGHEKLQPQAASQAGAHCADSTVLGSQAVIIGWLCQVMLARPYGSMQGKLSPNASAE